MHIVCAHEQKAHGIMHEWALSIGLAMMANKKGLFVTLMDRISRFEAN